MKTHEINELQLLVNTVSEKAHLLAGTMYAQGYTHAQIDAGKHYESVSVDARRTLREDELLRAVVALQLALRHDAAERSDATPAHEAADAGASC